MIHPPFGAMGWVSSAGVLNLPCDIIWTSGTRTPRGAILPFYAYGDDLEASLGEEEEGLLPPWRGTWLDELLLLELRAKGCR